MARRSSEREWVEAGFPRNRRQTRIEKAMTARCDGWSHDTAISIAHGQGFAAMLVAGYNDDLDPLFQGVHKKLTPWPLEAWMRGGEENDGADTGAATEGCGGRADPDDTTRRDMEGPLSHGDDGETPVPWGGSCVDC